MNIRPLYDRIVVKRNAAETVSSGGIILALDEEVKEPQGVIVAVGSETQLEAGSEVLFNKHAGMEVNVNGEDFLVMREDDVIAVLS